MITAEASGGRSFKGAAAYYLHDKREAGEAERSTTDRVAWTEAVNLPTEDPERAWRMMAHTAMAQADLKSAAGVKGTGRKLTKPVYAYSLSWHPDEKPTREQQMQAARESLAALDLQNFQALIVCHNDEPHPHVHILVNRVSPDNGIAAPLNKSRLALSSWALAYTKARGTDHLTPEREKNHERRKRREPVEATRKPRAAFERERETANDNLTFAFTRTEQRQKDAQLYASGRQMAAAHRKQWQGLNQTYATVKDRVRTNANARKEGRAAEIKEQAKPRWRHLFEAQKRERAVFEAGERSTLTRMLHIVSAWSQMREERPEASRLAIFCALLSSSQRHTLFEKGQESERRALAQAIRAEIRTAHRDIDKGMNRDLAKLHREYTNQSAPLTQTHKQQESLVERSWQQRKRERRAAYAPFAGRAPRQDDRQQGRGRTIHDDDRYRAQPPGFKPGGP